MRICEPISIKEYDRLTCEVEAPGYTSLPENIFTALENFLLANNTMNRTEAAELLSLSARPGIGKIITAKNYVGLITMTDGTVIEILPKIAGGEISISDARRLLGEMLKSLKDIAFKDFNISHLRTDRMNLMEIFIKMFLDEVAILTKQGLKASYIPMETNERFYKGKLLAGPNIKYNLVNKERFFFFFYEFKINRPENRLIKTTINFLIKQTKDASNRQKAANLLAFFESVAYSADFEADFSKSFIDRSMDHYSKALSWCRIFLRGNSFTAYSGSEIAIALLFPMEKVFEGFVAAKLRKHIGDGVTIQTQDRRYSLFDMPTSAFAIRPDIVLECEGHKVIIDTKWKLLSENTSNNGILQSDMYQMYAYGKKYETDSTVLLYPRSDAMNKTAIQYAANDNIKVDVVFIDLRDADSSILWLLEKLALFMVGIP
jgi:5-methylcytosine-specific restriction enzyme subunit McrC